MRLPGFLGGKKGANGKPPGAGKPGESRDEKKARNELLDYVEKNLKKGYGEPSIRESLAGVGWQKAQIDEAFSSEKAVKAKALQEKNDAERKEKGVGKDAGKKKDDGKEKDKKADEKKRKDALKAEEKKQKEEEKRKREEKKAEEETGKKKAGEKKEKEDRKKDEEKKKQEGQEKKGKKKKKHGISFHFGFPKIRKGKKAPNADKKGKKKKKGGKAEEEPSGEGKDETAGGGGPGKKKKRPFPKFPVRINVVPGSYRSWVGRQLYLSGSDTDPIAVIKKFAIVCLMISAVAAVIFSRYLLYVFLGAFGMAFAFMNAMLVLSVDRRGRFVDEILPDALLLLSANIRAGYIPSRALILSARKEFGPLSDGIRKAGKEIMTGTSLEDGLMQIPQRIKSKDLERTIKLITEGIKGGGQIVTLLEENAIDIRRRQAIRKEISANIMMYAIFIAFAGCLGAPGLYALSSYLTTTMAALTPDTSMAGGVSGKVSFLSMSGSHVSSEFLFQFSIAAILITTVFGGLILGLINSGREKDGLKFAPILAIIALGVFFSASFLVSTMFSSMLPG